MQLPTETQAKLDKLTADLKAAQARNDVAGQAEILNAIGTTYFGLGEMRKALDYFNQESPIWHVLGDRANEATTLNNIGLTYSSMGEKQKALEYLNQALPILREMGDRRMEATTLNNIGMVYRELGEKQKALEFLNQAMPIRRDVGDRAGEAATQNNIGLVYYDLGEKQKALDYYSQALPILREVGDRRTEARTLNNIGKAYYDLGQLKKALDYYGRAGLIPIGDDPAFEAGILNNIGEVYCDLLGEKQKALDYFNQALLTWRKVGDPSGEATALNNIGNVYLSLSEKQKALDYYSHALPVSRQAGARGDEATTLNNIGAVYRDLGDMQKALDYYSQALPISRQVGDRRSETTTLTNIGAVYRDLGDKQKALRYYDEALPIAAYISDPRLQALVLENLSRLEEIDRPSLGILYGKLAINLLQQLRGSISGRLQEKLQKSFLSTVADYYHDLATLLIKQGRLPEAQQVLNLLKNQEYKDYVRGETVDRLGSLTLTPAEQSAEEDYQRSTARVVEQGRRWSELKQDKARTPEEDKEFQQLSDSLGKASELMNDYFARLYKLFSEGADANRQVANITDDTASLKQQIAKMPNTVALYTVVSKDRYSVIVISGPTMVAREYAIPDKDLYQKIAAFRQIILDPSKDPKPLAQELYKILIGPIKADLDQARAQTLIWSLDGALRYVPFAALYDGQHYLIETYSLASFTPASIAHISEKPDLSAVSAVGMGISGAFDEKLKPLPMVEAELESVVHDPQMKGATGVMPGTVLLNAKFTELAMEKQLDGQHSVVHIASHFVMRPGDDTQSSSWLEKTAGPPATT